MIYEQPQAVVRIFLVHLVEVLLGVNLGTAYPPFRIKKYGYG